MRSFLTPIAGAMAMFLVALSVMIWLQNREIRELARALTAAAEQDQHRQHEMEEARAHHAQLLQEAENRMAQLRNELAGAREALALRQPGANPEAPRSAEFVEYERQQQRRFVQDRYGDLFPRLNVPPEQLERFKELLVERNLATRGIALAAPIGEGAAGNSGEGATAPAEVAPRALSEIDQEIRAVLGPENTAVYQDYGYELTETRPQVNRFAADAAQAGFPLTSGQQGALSQVIFETGDPRKNPAAREPGAQIPHPETGLSPLDELVLARAAEVLSSEQLPLFRTFRIEERKRLEAWRKVVNPTEASTAPPANPEH